MGWIMAVLILVAIVWGTCSCVRIIPQSEAWVTERLGVYANTWERGIHIKTPFIERVVKKVSLKEQLADFPPQPVITKDNVTMQIDTVVFFQITDPKLYTYGVNNPLAAIENLTATTLRNIIGSITLDDTLTSRDEINSKMRIVLDDVTDPWGIKVNRVELKNIIPPRQIQEAMEKQMKAEREKREQVLTAQGTKESEILRAEGSKASRILTAEADKESRILAAEAEAASILKVQEAKAAGIKLVKEAEAEGIKLLKQAGADEAVIRLKSLETLSDMANGQATKIVIPSDLQALAGTLTGLKESINS